jgi:pimeloyl-ACP methyl ester carboxylesterase
MSPIVLVHGAWMDASAWNAVIPHLRQLGYADITAVNLPGHGADTTPYEQIQLASYTEAVKAAIGAKQDVILVGHSLAGIVISQVAEEVPTQLARLVYVAAYLPRDGESLYGLSQQDPDSHVGRFWQQADPAHYSPASIAAEGIEDVFAADCDAATVAELIRTHKADALAPMATPVHLTAERFGRVPKTYLHTTHDNAVSYALQRQMVAGTPVQATYELATSHSPFFSQPAQLAALLVQ